MSERAAAVDVLALPEAAGLCASGRTVDALADELLKRLRSELDAPVAAAPTQPALPLELEVEDALYAWGVSCYEVGRHADASALFDALCRRQPPSLRLLKAAGASHLARADYVRSAQTYAQAHTLAAADAEVLFFWAQADCLLGQGAVAAGRLRQAVGLTQAFPHKWPGLQAWCDELLAQLDDAHARPP